MLPSGQHPSSRQRGITYKTPPLWEGAGKTLIVYNLHYEEKKLIIAFSGFASFHITHGNLPSISFRVFFLLASMLRFPCFPLAFLFLKRGGGAGEAVLQSCPKYTFCYLSILLSMKNTAGLYYLNNGKEGC